MDARSSRHAHPSDFFLVAEEYRECDLLKMLGITQVVLRRWRQPGARIPWSAYQLVLERSQYGLAERDAAEGFNRRMLLMQLQSLESRVRELSAIVVEQSRLINWGCANDPFISPQDPRSASIA